MKYLLVSILVVFLTSFSFATEEAAENVSEQYILPMSVGPSIVFKAGVCTNHPHGVENRAAFNGVPDLGASFYLPFSKKESKIGLQAELAYSTIAYGRNNYRNDDVKWTVKFHYLSFAPLFHLHGFLIGFNFGLPLGGVTDEADIESSEMDFLIEARIGAVIPLIANEFGRWNLVLTGGYALTGLLKDVDDNNPLPASMGIGFSYLFNIGNNE